MTAEEYRKRLMDIFHETGHEEYISLMVEPTEGDFKLLEDMLLFADEVAHKGYIGQQQLERFIEELEE